MKSYYTPNPHLLDLVVTTNYGSKPHFLFCQSEMPHFNVITIYNSENTLFIKCLPFQHWNVTVYEHFVSFNKYTGFARKWGGKIIINQRENILATLPDHDKVFMLFHISLGTTAVSLSTIVCRCFACWSVCCWLWSVQQFTPPRTEQEPLYSS